ncbi:MAG: enoyl-CoA hydratase/isomerase family protein [Thermomicrobium sp.]|uniref:enoyl-CoA hydratase/isomerase family protein n=1 Tax=Thermomicrobium sp. TaxID=1969469 RepID=UPI001B258C7F|nr:enoyl-CoA hydratase/isomerase family protein [Thermomicrobium sp.]MBO9360489.1 enoyl-CoA hydratase/isomerase family protein [Thermomicrobium sp.]
MSDLLVTLQTLDDTAIVTLNRPEKLNALNLELVSALRDTLLAVANDARLRLVIIRGAGRSFCSGLDLDMMAAEGMPPEFYPVQEEAFRLIETMNKLVVAAIHGYCLGGGVQLAIACDLRIASDDTVLALPAINEGLFPGMAPYRLPRLIGLGLARRYIYTGDPIPLDLAHQIGLIDWIIPARSFEDELEKLLQKLRAVPFTAAIHGKQLMANAFDQSFSAAYHDSLWRLEQCLSSDDVARARALWIERKQSRTAQRP